MKFYKRLRLFFGLLSMCGLLMLGGCSFVDESLDFIIEVYEELTGEREESTEEILEEQSEDISENDMDLESDRTEAFEDSTEEVFAEEINDFETLCRYIDSELKKGNTEIAFETTGISEKEILDINAHLDGFYGSIQQYTSKKQLLSDQISYTLQARLTDNTSVEQYFKTQKEIPEEDRKARELAQACERILEQMEEELPQDASPYRKEKWIHDYLVSHTEYGYQNKNASKDDIAFDSYGALVYGKAVCNGYAYAMKLLCDLSGIPCRIVVGRGKEESHAWNMVSLGGAWYYVDVTWDDPTPDQADRIIYTYFNITGEMLSMDHEWKREKYPEADATEYNYYRINELYCKDYKSFKKKCIEIMDTNEDIQKMEVMVGDYDPEVYSKENLHFLFDYTDYRSMNFQSIGGTPYATMYITFQ